MQNQISTFEPNAWKVPSASHPPHKHTVRLENGVLKCSCPKGCQERRNPTGKACRHIRQVLDAGIIEDTRSFVPVVDPTDDDPWADMPIPAPAPKPADGLALIARFQSELSSRSYARV